MTAKKLHLVLVLFTAFACQAGEVVDDQKQENILGKWQLYEYGYSPGDEYITEEVPAFPVKTISILKNNVFSSNMEEFTGYHFYLILKDPNNGSDVLALFHSKPAILPTDLEGLSPTYNIAFNNGRLKLSFRFCIEGCHLGFKKILS